MRHSRKILAIVITFIVIATPLFAHSQTVFDPAYVLSDAELITYDTMNHIGIEDFLRSKTGILKNVKINIGDGTNATAAELIYKASRDHRINPKFLIALLQKEQSLIEDSTPKQTQLDWATGYGCFDNVPCNERWKGFHKQVNSAAAQFRYYFDNIREYPYQPGKASTIDGKTVIPRNVTTAALYNYTPHLHGNELLRSIWDRYFINSIPDGTLVSLDDEDGVWLIQSGTKRPITSQLALVSRYNPEHIVSITQSDLDQFPIGTSIDFAAYSLLESDQTGKIYLLTTDKKRYITSMEVFRNLGFNPEEVEVVAESRLITIPNGRDVTFSDAYPTGALLQDKTNGMMYYVEAGRKYKIISTDIMAVNYPGQQLSKVDTAIINKYASGFPVLLKEGTLVKGTGSEVYVISNGKKLHIASEGAFKSIGYSWSNIVITSDEVLALHSTGEPLNLQ